MKHFSTSRRAPTLGSLHFLFSQVVTESNVSGSEAGGSKGDAESV